MQTERRRFPDGAPVVTRNIPDLKRLNSNAPKARYILEPPYAPARFRRYIAIGNLPFPAN